MRYGTVFFDSALERRSIKNKETSTVLAREGWASVSGLPASRINKIADLPSDVVWMVNLDFQSYVSNGLSKLPNFVPYYFLKSDVNQIAAEIGAHVEHERLPVIVQAVAEVFSRTMRLAEKHFGIEDIQTRTNNGKKLEFCIAEAIGRRQQVIDAALNQALNNAHQPRNQVLAHPIPREWWQVTLRRNRYAHAFEVLESPVPSPNNWEFVDGDRLPTGQTQRIDWAIDNERPVLVHARVSDGKGVEATLTSFGNKPKGNVPREWLSAPELYWVSRYGRVEIDAAYICNEGFCEMPELSKMPPPNELSLASISLGLLTENFLAVLMEPYKNPMGVQMCYPHSVWYNSMDRFIMFTHAARLVKMSSYGSPTAGFRIHSYGFGNIQVGSPHEAIDDLTDFASSIGLEVPSSAYWKRTMQFRQRNVEGLQ